MVRSSWKITKISVYQHALHLHEETYKWSGGKSVEEFDSTIVEITASAGEETVVGVGEITPLGPFYLPAFGAGARAAINELAPHLLGKDPTLLHNVNDVMDKSLLGHPYAKSAIDMACWDILGKVTGQPVAVLLGGLFGEKMTASLYRAISQDTPEAMAESVKKYRKEGYTKFQLKVGDSAGNVNTDIARILKCREALPNGELLVADTNTGWRKDEAMKVINAVKHVDVYIEQPCASYEENLSVRRHCPLPFVLDENIDGLPILLRAHGDGAMDMINLKISKVGGLTKAKQIRDLCVSLGVPMNIEDTWGGDIVTAAIMHLAQSTPERFRLMCTDFNSYCREKTCTIAPRRQEDGSITCGTAPGLGVVLDKSVVNRLVAEYVL